MPLVLCSCDAVLGLGDEPGRRPGDAGLDHEIAEAGVTSTDAAEAGAVDTPHPEAGADAADTSPPPLEDPTSCSVILARNLAQGSRPASGIYLIAERGKRLVYCDMVTDGGGWTAIYSGTNGVPSGNFQDPESSAECPEPDTSCVHRAPLTLDARTEFLVTCGAAAIAFSPGPAGLDFFQKGIPTLWVSLASVRAVTGGANALFARQLWTGDSANNGFIFSERENETDPQAASVNTFGNGYNFSSKWNYCNGAPDTTSTVRIFYR